MDKTNHPTCTSLTTCYTWKYVALQKWHFKFQNCNQVVNARGVCFSLKAKWFWMRTTSSGRLSHPCPVWEVHPSGQMSHWHSTHAGGCGMKKDARASEELWKLKQRCSFLSWEVPAIFTPQLYWISHSENTWRYEAIFLSKGHSVFLNMAITAQKFEFNHEMHPGAMKCVWN